jgi:hypothetical protein
MKVAYPILAHANPAMLKALVTALNKPKEMLLQSPAYFARKFDLSIDSNIVEFLKNQRVNE